MPGPSRERFEALGRAALEYCTAHGITEHPVSRAHCAAFAAQAGCTLETARRHLRLAVAYQQRGAEAVPPGWGGARPGSGRKPKA